MLCRDGGRCCFSAGRHRWTASAVFESRVSPAAHRHARQSPAVRKGACSERSAAAPRRPGRTPSSLAALAGPSPPSRVRHHSRARSAAPRRPWPGSHRGGIQPQGTKGGIGEVDQRRLQANDQHTRLCHYFICSRQLVFSDFHSCVLPTVGRTPPRLSRTPCFPLVRAFFLRHEIEAKAGFGPVHPSELAGAPRALCTWSSNDENLPKGAHR